MSQVVRIVPRMGVGNGPLHTKATRVITEEGAEIHGITRIVLTAEVGDVWRAQIDCMVQPSEIRALADVAESLTLWQRVCVRAAGINWRSGMSMRLPAWICWSTVMACVFSAGALLLLAFMLLPPEHLPAVFVATLLVILTVGGTLWSLSRMQSHELQMEPETEDTDSAPPT
jgi:hypothetical protein